MHQCWHSIKCYASCARLPTQQTMKTVIAMQQHYWIYYYTAVYQKPQKMECELKKVWWLPFECWRNIIIYTICVSSAWGVKKKKLQQNSLLFWEQVHHIYFNKLIFCVYIQFNFNHWFGVFVSIYCVSLWSNKPTYTYCVVHVRLSCIITTSENKHGSHTSNWENGPIKIKESNTEKTS